ncbi:unnamed protein product [Coregonus sp. 'balchen']|nr:unnamed protein product [Coregonus sp. 'balchen']
MCEDVGKLKPGANPFEVLDDNIFPFRKKEKESRKLELQSQLGLQVHEKVYAGRMKAKQADLRRNFPLTLKEVYVICEDPELYFRDPWQLLELVTELEEQNLSLIQNSRETEEAQEEFRQVMDYNRKKMEVETNQLTQQIDIMTHTIQREKERAAELELRARLFRMRDEKMRQDKQNQEERLKRALERAQADVKKTTVKKLMARSQRLARKLKTSQVYDISDKEKEEQLYFFT